MKINPLMATDFYKTGHIFQYPEGTSMVYSNLTARSDKYAKFADSDHRVVFFGLQGFIKWFLIDCWNNEFFNKPKDVVVAAYKRRMDTSLGPNVVSVDHIEALHDLQYLPIQIKALPEGSLVPHGVPMLTIASTHPDFFWVTNYLETVLSSELWKPITNATMAYQYKKILSKYADETGVPQEGVVFQGHDFSFRGMSGVFDAATSGAAHLTSFVGTDTIPAIDYVETYYNGNAEKELIGCSVPATEHSVMCMGTKEAEIETFKRLITKLYPTGIISIVSDTWDFWKVITEYAAELKNDILARNSGDPNKIDRVVFRPDSGDPVKIITGYKLVPSQFLPLFTKSEWLNKGYEAYTSEDGRNFCLQTGKELSTAEVSGAVQCLWNIFGGTYAVRHKDNSVERYKVLDSHVGLIYGDSITLERAELILKRLKEKGFASNNVVFGIGSYTYQYQTRDGHGMAIKSTYGVVKGAEREIFKAPITDDGTKISARGLLYVEKGLKNQLVMIDRVSRSTEVFGELKSVFVDGKLLVDDSFYKIRSRLMYNAKE
jgi:nicotinamide phosphoribosyltransferase